MLVGVIIGVIMIVIVWTCYTEVFLQRQLKLTKIVYKNIFLPNRAFSTYNRTLSVAILNYSTIFDDPLVEIERPLPTLKIFSF